MKKTLKKKTKTTRDRRRVKRLQLIRNQRCSGKRNKRVQNPRTGPAGHGDNRSLQGPRQTERRVRGGGCRSPER